MQVGMVTRKMFFDSKGVVRRVDKATRRVLSRFGAFVRTAAQSSIRTRKGVSKPGHPPHAHHGLLKPYILFGYDRARRSVVIGPMKLNQKVGNAPEALEHGGVSVITEWAPRGEKRSTRRVRIAARPFMGPAMAQEKPKLPKMWADSIR